MKSNWEIIQDNGCISTSRLKVYEGWIVRYWNGDDSNGMVFVPDRHHAWSLDEKIECGVSGVKIDD